MSRPGHRSIRGRLASTVTATVALVVALVVATDPAAADIVAADIVAADIAAADNALADNALADNALDDPIVGQTRTRELVGGLNVALLVLAVPILLAVEGLLLYAALRFRHREEPATTPKNRKLELGWTVATAAVLVLVVVASYAVMADPTVTYGGDEVAPDEEDVHVHFEAYQWGWDARYPDEGVAVDGREVVVPVDRDVYVTVTSRDVIHGFHVPEMALKIDAIPGERNAIRTHTTETGTYRGYCSEYCGQGHSHMGFEVAVVDEEAYEAWLARQSDPGES